MNPEREKRTHTMKYDVQVKIAPSQGGLATQVTTVPVTALNEAGAIVAATMILDTKGIDRFDLVKVVPASN